MELCQRCMLSEESVLSVVAHSRKRSLKEMARQQQQQRNILSEEAERNRQDRLEEKHKEQAELEHDLKEYDEELSYQIMDDIFKGEADAEVAQKVAADEKRKELEKKLKDVKYQPDELSSRDIEKSLQQHVDKGDLRLEKGEVRFTPQGARKLANYILRRILQNLADRQLGYHSLEQEGYGVDRSAASRKYEVGDEYDKIDFERTFLNALARDSRSGPAISLLPDDFQIYEDVHQTRMIAGLMMDESESMSGDKINAAIDCSLALSELIRREPKDLLKVFLFSDVVREIPWYDVLNAAFVRGTTDIMSALRAFRRAVANQEGDKQAYLITDTEPNTEDRKFVGFERAAKGVIEEAYRYRQAGITLNVIMLDERPQLKELAGMIARRNLGRVFFASPQKLGEIIIQDYLRVKKKSRQAR